MRTYRVSGMKDEGDARAIEEAVKGRIGPDMSVRADVRSGVVRASESADPQIVIFAIEGAGFRVEQVPD